PVHGDRHPEPDRAGRHLPAAGGTTGPVPDEDLARLPGPGPHPGDPGHRWFPAPVASVVPGAPHPGGRRDGAAGRRGDDPAVGAGVHPPDRRGDPADRRRPARGQHAWLPRAGAHLTGVGGGPGTPVRGARRHQDVGTALPDAPPHPGPGVGVRRRHPGRGDDPGALDRAAAGGERRGMTSPYSGASPHTGPPVTAAADTTRAGGPADASTGGHSVAATGTPSGTTGVPATPVTPWQRFRRVIGLLGMQPAGWALLVLVVVLAIAGGLLGWLELRVTAVAGLVVLLCALAFTL